MFKRRFSILNQLEKITVTFLSLVVAVSGFQIGHAFYDEHTEMKPVQGGVYTEGAVGKVDLINPLYVSLGSVSHDLTTLIFSGLTRFDPKTNEIVPDLADFTVSSNGKEYTFVIKDNAKWHDGAPVTSADILFTYNSVINTPGFNGLILNYNDYSGIKVAEVDERTVKFLLESPDSFFLVKTLAGILPSHLLGHLPVEAIESDPYNLFPVGSGPYQFVSLTPIEDYSEVTLEAYEGYYGKAPNIPTIKIKVFSHFKELIKRQGDLDGIRNLPEENTEKILSRGRLSLTRYHLPQYVAVFMNTQAEVLKDPKVRLALQLGTDKDAIVETLGQTKRIDTPLLEIDQKNWVYQYSINKANGALFETEWQLPDKVDETIGETIEETIEEIIEDEESAEPEFITGPNGGKDWQTTDKKITITGTVPDKTKSIFVNDYELKKYIPGDLGWSYVASFEFENLKKGNNLFEVYAVGFDEEKSLIDSITITQGTEDQFIEEELKEIAVENLEADVLPIRLNDNDETLILRMVVPKTPEAYSQVASVIKEQWKKVGIGLTIEVLENGEFQEALFKRNYDLLIFGQNLGYNLDAYPYWHSSQAKEGGYNLSQFKNFIVDSLLDKARLEDDVEDRKRTLGKIQEIISKEIPAIFLYSPTYNFALSDKIQNATFENLATTTDRFARIHDWYARVDRRFAEGVNPLTFVSWIVKQF